MKIAYCPECGGALVKEAMLGDYVQYNCGGSDGCKKSFVLLGPNREAKYPEALVSVQS